MINATHLCKDKAEHLRVEAIFDHLEKLTLNYEPVAGDGWSAERHDLDDGDRIEWAIAIREGDGMMLRLRRASIYHERTAKHLFDEYSIHHVEAGEGEPAPDNFHEAVIPFLERNILGREYYVPTEALNTEIRALAVKAAGLAVGLRIELGLRYDCNPDAVHNFHNPVINGLLLQQDDEDPDDDLADFLDWKAWTEARFGLVDGKAIVDFYLSGPDGLITNLVVEFDRTGVIRAGSPTLLPDNIIFDRNA